MPEEVKDVPVTGTAETPPASPETPAAETGTQPTETPQEPKRNWAQARIAELTAKFREEERRNIALEALLAQKGATPSPEQDFDTRVRQSAAEMSRLQTLNDSANRTYEAGKAKFKDFDSAVQNFASVADLSEKPEFLEAITRLPNGADVYYHLGNHLEDAHHVLSLSPVQMGLELARISAQVGKPVPVSKAPVPVTQVGGTAAPSEGLDDKLPIKEWMARREKQVQPR